MEKKAQSEVGTYGKLREPASDEAFLTWPLDERIF